MRGAFKFLWACDAVAGAIVVLFFIAGVADGSVSSFNAGIWAIALAVVGFTVCGSLLLRNAGYLRLGVLVASILAVPALLYALFMLVVITTATSWN